MEPIVRIQSVTGIDLELRLAGTGGRSYAFIVDWHIRTLVALGWFVAGSWLLLGGLSPANAVGSPLGYSVGVLLPSAAIYLLYHPVLELAMQGQTPGKRIAGLRLIALATGGTPSVGAILVRNVFRLIDSLPMLYALGLITTVLTKHAQRVGDLAAGTALIYEEVPADDMLDRIGGGSVQRLGLARAQLAREILDRWPWLRPAAKTKLASDLLASLGVPPPGDDDDLRRALEDLIA